MPKNIEPIYKTQMTLWFAFVMSQIMFVVIIYFAKPEVFKFDFSQNLFHPMALILGFLALMNIGLSFFFRATYNKEAIEQQNPQIVQTALILAWAFCESLSIFGLVLAFSIAYPLFFVWSALGILGTILHFPKRTDLINATYKK